MHRAWPRARSTNSSADWFRRSTDPEHASAVVRPLLELVSRRPRRAAAGGHGARLRARHRRQAALRRRESHRPHPAGLGDLGQDRRRLRRHRAADPGEAGSRGFWRSRYSMEYLVRNARSEPVTLDIRQGGLWREGKVAAREPQEHAAGCVHAAVERAGRRRTAKPSSRSPSRPAGSRMRSVAIALAWVLLSPAASADVVSPAPESVRVTIYRTAQVDVPAYEDEADYAATTMRPLAAS